MEQDRIRHPRPNVVTTNSISPSPTADVNNDDDGVWRSIRSIPPADFVLHIKSFTSLPKMLENLDDVKYKSGVFPSGGYNWRLYLYPNGDVTKSGSGFISLYLVIAEPCDLPLHWEVNVNFKLFIHDQIRDTYLTIQDLHGKIRRFHNMKREHGYTKLITLDNFRNASNGFLVDDTCTFGAEIYVMPCNSRAQISRSVAYSLPDGPHLAWVLHDFSKKGAGCYSSDVLVYGPGKWKFHIHPKGDKMHKGKLSLYLELLDDEVVASRFNFMRLFRKYNHIYAHLSIRVKDQTSGRHVVRKVELSTSQSRYQGDGDFMKLDHLVNNSERFLVNDTLIVEAIFTYLFELKRT